MDKHPILENFVVAIPRNMISFFNNQNLKASICGPFCRNTTNRTSTYNKNINIHFLFLPTKMISQCLTVLMIICRSVVLCSGIIKHYVTSFGYNLICAMEALTLIK